MSAPALTAEAPWKAGLRGARANLLPGLALQVAALGLVLAYYFNAPFHALLERLSAFRAETGLGYAMVATPVFGGLLPFLYLRADPATRARHPWAHLPFFMGFWLWKGVEVDLLYKGLAASVGAGHDLVTISIKVLIDQLAYNPLWAAPTGVLAFAWKDCGFRWRPLRADLAAGRWYARRVWPALLSTWGVWIPAVSLIYALPSSLQLPLFNVVLCFWTLLFSHVVTPAASAPRPGRE